MGWLDRLRQWARGVRPDPALAEQLVDVARATAETRGWPWGEPADVTVAASAPDRRTWTVRSPRGARGRSVVITIRESDLEVVDASFLPR